MIMQNKQDKIIFERFSTTNSGANTPQDAGNRSIENSDTEHDDSFRYDSGHIALDYGTGIVLFHIG